MSGSCIRKIAGPAGPAVFRNCRGGRCQDVHSAVGSGSATVRRAPTVDRQRGQHAGRLRRRSSTMAPDTQLSATQPQPLSGDAAGRHASRPAGRTGDGGNNRVRRRTHGPRHGPHTGGPGRPGRLGRVRTHAALRAGTFRHVECCFQPNCSTTPRAASANRGFELNCDELIADIGVRAVPGAEDTIGWLRTPASRSAWLPASGATRRTWCSNRWAGWAWRTLACVPRTPAGAGRSRTWC